MRVPAGLGVAGKRLWQTVTKGLPKDWELDERELEILRLAARQADDVAALEKSIARDGVTVNGSAGQPRVNPAVTEVRGGRLALGRLLGMLELPGDDEAPRSEASLRAQRAARARWAGHEPRRRRGAA